MTISAIQHARRELPLLDERIYLNVAGLGPLPRRTVAAIHSQYSAYVTHGQYAATGAGPVRAQAQLARRLLAAAIGCGDPLQIAWTANTTEAIHLVLDGFDWRPGDVILTTDQENPAALIACKGVAERHRLEVRTASIHGSDPVAAAMDARCAKTRVCLFSHVSHVTGSVLPIKDLCMAFHAAGVPIIWDGAQAVGNVEVDVSDAGTAFYCGAAYKWLYGPYGIGFCHMSRNWMRTLQAPRIGLGSEKSFDQVNLDLVMSDDMDRYMFGARAWPLIAAFGESLSMLSDIGFRTIAAAHREHRGYAARRLEQDWRVTLIGDDAAGSAAGILTFVLDDANARSVDARSLVAALDSELGVVAQWRMLPPGWGHDVGIRLSFPFAITASEIDTAIDAVLSR